MREAIYEGEKHVYVMQSRAKGDLATTHLQSRRKLQSSVAPGGGRNLRQLIPGFGTTVPEACLPRVMRTCPGKAGHQSTAW